MGGKFEAPPQAQALHAWEALIYLARQFPSYVQVFGGSEGKRDDRQEQTTPDSIGG